MQSADDVHLGDALVIGLLRLPRHLLDVVGELALLFVRPAGEGAELAAQDADVGVVEIEIEDVGRDVAVLPFADVIGEIAERVEVLHRVEPQPSSSVRRCAAKTFSAMSVRPCAGEDVSMKLIGRLRDKRPPESRCQLGQ